MLFDKTLLLKPTGKLLKALLKAYLHSLSSLLWNPSKPPQCHSFFETSDKRSSFGLPAFLWFDYVDFTNLFLSVLHLYQSYKDKTQKMKKENVKKQLEKKHLVWTDMFAQQYLMVNAWAETAVPLSRCGLRSWYSEPSENYKGPLWVRPPVRIRLCDSEGAWHPSTLYSLNCRGGCRAPDRDVSALKGFPVSTL